MALEHSARTRVYVGLGSNLQDPIGQLHQALTALRQLPESQLVCCSSLYRSAPMGPAGQPDYINAVAALDTYLSPVTLLHALQQIEQQQGRVRAVHWGPRTLDLDILLFGGQILDTSALTVPHKGMQERNFVLYPLYEIAPELEIPGQGKLQTLLDACPHEGLERLKETV